MLHRRATFPVCLLIFSLFYRTGLVSHDVSYTLLESKPPKLQEPCTNLFSWKCVGMFIFLLEPVLYTFFLEYSISQGYICTYLYIYIYTYSIYIGWRAWRQSVLYWCSTWTDIFEVSLLVSISSEYKSASCIHFVANFYWSELDIVCGSTREWICCIWILLIFLSRQHSCRDTGSGYRYFVLVDAEWVTGDRSKDRLLDKLNYLLHRELCGQVRLVSLLYYCVNF